MKIINIILLAGILSFFSFELFPNEMFQIRDNEFKLINKKEIKLIDYKDDNSKAINFLELNNGKIFYGEELQLVKLKNNILFNGGVSAGGG